MDNPRQDQQQDVHELVRIRLDKIKELQAKEKVEKESASKKVEAEAKKAKK